MVLTDKERTSERGFSLVFLMAICFRSTGNEDVLVKSELPPVPCKLRLMKVWRSLCGVDGAKCIVLYCDLNSLHKKKPTSDGAKRRSIAGGLGRSEAVRFIYALGFAPRWLILF